MQTAPIWKDATGYSRDKERIPTTWSIHIGDFKITVTKGHIHHPGKWVFHCDPWFKEREIGDDTLPADYAQRQALDAVRDKLLKAASAFDCI